MDTLCAPCPRSREGFGPLPHPTVGTLQQPCCGHPSSFGAGCCSHGCCEFVGAQCPPSEPGAPTAPPDSRPGLLPPVPGRGRCRALGMRFRERPSPAHRGPASARPRPPTRRWSPPSRQGARWVARSSGASRHFPLSFRGRCQHGGSGSRHPPPSSGGPAPPRRGAAVGAEGERGQGLWGAVGAGIAGERGDRGGGRWAWARRSLTGGPPARPRVGTRPDEDGEESGAGDHREVLHTPRE